MLLYLDTDTSPTTGWQGFDYLVLHGWLYRFDAASHTWQPISPVAQTISERQLTLLIPRKSLNLNQELFSIDFKWADNPTDPFDIISICTTGDTAPNRRFCYRFRWQK